MSQNRTTNLATNTPTFNGFTVGNAREVNATDRFFTAKANVKRDFAQFCFPFSLQTGVSWREQRRNIDLAHRRRWFYISPDGVQGTADDTANYGQFENSGFYRFSVLAGLSGERTKDHGNGPITGNKAATDITDRIQQARAIYTSKRADADTAYTNWFPSVQAKYNITSDLPARVVYTQSVGRQNLGDIIPGVTVSNATPATLTVNNLGLLPQVYYNVDASPEYYLKPVGLLSVGFFDKKIKNYTRSVSETIVSGVDYNVGIGTDDNVGGLLTRLQKVGDAYIRGWELNYSQQPERSSALRRGVGVFANYTSLKTRGNDGAATTSPLPLDNFIPHTFNTGVSYKHRAFTGSVKYNYKSHYPTSASAATYNYDHGTYDVALAWQLRREISLLGEVKNVFNRQRDTCRVLPPRLQNYATPAPSSTSAARACSELGFSRLF